MILVYSYIGGINVGFYIGLLTFGYILIPTIGAVFIYLLIEGITSFKEPIISKFIQVVLLFLVFIIGLYVWAGIDSFLYNELTLWNVQLVFNKEFKGFLPVVFTEALSIPLIDLFLKKNN